MGKRLLLFFLVAMFSRVASAQTFPVVITNSYQSTGNSPLNLHIGSVTSTNLTQFQVNKKLVASAVSPGPTATTGAIHSIQTAFGKLKTFVADNGFASQAEEIHFFKKEKPRFTAEHYFAMEIFSIETARPLTDLAQLKTFYEHELTYVNRFLEQNKFLYAYYQFDLTDLDHSLFIKGAKPVDIPVTLLEEDSTLHLSCDLKTAEQTLTSALAALDKIDEYLDLAIAANPDSMITSKWGTYLPPVLQRELLKSTRYDFAGAGQFLANIRLIRHEDIK